MRYFILAFVALLAGAIFYMVQTSPNADARQATGALNEITREARTITYFDQGTGPVVVLLASAGREVSDFNELVGSLVAANYRTIAIEAPGIGGSTLPENPMSLHDLADDVAAVVRQLNLFPGEQVTILGHAFGNRVARTFASDYPEMTAATIVVAAGGKVEIETRANEALFNCFNPLRPAIRRKEDVRYGFFANDNPIPDYWMRGWHIETARLQGAATRATPSEDFWTAGNDPLLVVQAMGDRIAPPEHTADLLEEELGGRVTVVRIKKAGHALLPEAPGQISDAVIEFLQRQSAYEE